MVNYFIVFFILAIISYLYLKLAVKYKIIDKPNERSSHTKITVRGGGILFTIAILLFCVLNDFQYLYFCLGVFIISIVSFLDDMYTLSAKVRFPFQIVSVLLILMEIGIPFVPVYMFILFLVLGVGLINMFNFMDGINGITGLYSLAVLSGIYMINADEQIINSDLLIYSIFSIVIFGFYNFRKKALFFAGDIGSITLGMLLFFVGSYIAFRLKAPLILLLVIVYGADASCTLVYRKLFTKESIFEPHRHHIYQKLVDIKKISHIKLSIIYASIQIVMNLIIYKTYTLNLQNQLILFFSLSLLFVVMYIFLFLKLQKEVMLREH